MTPRPLDTNERAVLDSLLSLDTSNAAVLREKLDDALVLPGCECGCGSLDFVVDSHTGIKSADRARIHPVEGEVLNDDGAVVGGLLLFVAGDRLDHIDVYSLAEQPLLMPDPEHVRWVTRP